MLSKPAEGTDKRDFPAPREAVLIPPSAQKKTAQPGWAKAGRWVSVEMCRSLSARSQNPLAQNKFQADCLIPGREVT